MYGHVEKIPDVLGMQVSKIVRLTGRVSLPTTCLIASANSNRIEEACDSSTPSEKAGSSCRFVPGPTRSVWRHGEDEVRSLRLAAADRHILRFRSVLFLPSRHGVLTGWQSFDVERPVATRDRVGRGLEYHKVAVHPRVNIAFHRNEFRLFPFGINRRRAVGLRLVPFLIYLRQRMDVVGSLVVVIDLQLLVRFQRQNMRNILTALLVVPSRLRRTPAAPFTGRNIDHDPFKRISWTGHNIFSRD